MRLFQRKKKMTMKAKVDSLLKWLRTSEQFYLATNISIHESDTSGRGVVLIDEKLTTNEVVISIPPSHQLNFYTILYHISMFNTKLDIHGITAASEENIMERNIGSQDPRFQAYGLLKQEFLLGLSSFQLLTLYILAEWILLPQWSSSEFVSYWKPFFDIWPAKEELGSVPAIWNLTGDSKYKELLHLSSLASKKHCSRISALVKSDWSVILPILKDWNTMFNGDANNELFLEKLYREFLHIYFVVNSRCLYADISLKKDDIDSQFTMVPYVDFLNHTDEVDVHCYPKLVKSSINANNLGRFEIRCGKFCYANKGEEILLNYGAHSNDLLLNEYGFTLPQNCWNCIDISDEITKLMDGQDTIVSFLKSNGYWGDYTISFNEISYRVLVALSLVITSDFKRVEKLLLGYISEDFFLPKIRPALQRLLLLLLDTYHEKLRLLRILPLSLSTCTENIANIYFGYIEIIENNLENM